MDIFRKMIGVLLLFFSVAELSAATSVGKVIAVEGTATANSRKLSRGAPIYVSDMINVESGSKIQIKFTDGGILNLIESTQYQISSYQFNSSSGSGSSSAELVKGGFRAVSGKIGQNNPDNYSVKTPVAVIGIRGTLFEANIKGGHTFFGCDRGAIRVANRAGERLLNAGEFVSSKSPNMLGMVTRVRPAALSNSLFSSPEGGLSQESAEENPESTQEEESEKEGEDEEIDEVDISESEGTPPC